MAQATRRGLVIDVVEDVLKIAVPLAAFRQDRRFRLSPVDPHRTYQTCGYENACGSRFMKTPTSILIRYEKIGEAT